MAGRAIPDHVKQQFWELVSKYGLKPTTAGKQLGVSEATAMRWYRGVNQSLAHDNRLAQADLPDPKSFDQLSTDAAEALRDFNVFCELFLARRPTPWRYDAAMRTVEALLDKSRKDFFVDNIAPGVGKTTLWTNDIPAWLTCGGGVMDPAIGRAIRGMLGSATKNVATHYVSRLRRLFELRRPFFDKDQRLEAKLVLSGEYGRFKPSEAADEESLWTKEQFIVAQVGEVDLYEKEPTWQAASRNSGFLGERFDYYAWDDLVNKQNSRTPEVADELNEWYEDEAETRLEPGGVGHLVGQRLGANDLFRRRLDYTYADEDGVERQRYQHIMYPAHFDLLCDDDHRQWDGHEDGCLLDAHRLPFREIVTLRSKPNFRTVYQQEDVDAESALVQQAWLDGTADIDGFTGPGCWDYDRSFFDWPQGVSALIDYVCVDPAAGGWWALEWWAVQPETRFRYLIWGTRKRMPAGQFLDYDPRNRLHVGLMEDTQLLSMQLGHPIQIWVIEGVSAFRHLFQYDHYRTWRQKWPFVHVIPHETQRNKHDPVLGVEATLPMAYRSGIKRLPRKQGIETLNYMRPKVAELTKYPHTTTDTVMTDWFGEANLEQIIRRGKRAQEPIEPSTDLKLPPYLARQYRTLSLVSEAS